MSQRRLSINDLAKRDERAAKALAGKKQKKERGEEGYLSDDEILTEAEEDIEDALIELNTVPKVM